VSAGPHRVLVADRPVCYSFKLEGHAHMAVIVFSDNTKYTIAEGEYATVTDGHLRVYEAGTEIARHIVAIFAPGKWERFVRDGSVVAKKSGNNAVALTGNKVEVSAN